MNLIIEETQNDGGNSNRIPLSSLPFHIVFQIGAALPRYPNSHSNAFLNFVLTSKRVFHILLPLFYNSIFVNEREYLLLDQRCESDLQFSESLRKYTQSFKATLCYDEEKSLQIPSFDRLNSVALIFVPPPDFKYSFIIRLPKSFALPLSAVNSIGESIRKLTSLRLDGLIFCDEMMRGLSNCFSFAKNLRSLEIGFTGFGHRENSKMKVTTENASLFSKSLASLNNLEKFNANVYWINSVEFQNLFIAGLHSMPKLTDLTLLFVLEEQLYPLFTEFLAESRISFLTLDNLDITNQLANGIKRMRFLTDFHVGRADCSITLLIPMPYSSVNKSLKNLTFWGLSFSDSEFVENGRIDLSEVDSFRITGIAGYASSGEVDLIPYLIQSLIGSAHLREFCCCVREETHFALVVEVIRTCPLLKIISVHNQTFKVVGLNLTADQIRLLEEPWFDSLRDSFYDAIDKSSVEKLQMTIRMVKKERLLRFLENSKTIGTVSIHTETMAELFDLSDLFRSVNLNSQSQFKTLSILLRILFSPPKSEIVRVYRHRSFVKVKFISTSESDENLPIYFGKILNSIIKSWESGCDIIDRVVLDELSDQDCKFLIQSCRSTFSFVKFEYKEGEYCCSR